MPPGLQHSPYCRPIKVSPGEDRSPRLSYATANARFAPPLRTPMAQNYTIEVHFKQKIAGHNLEQKLQQNQLLCFITDPCTTDFSLAFMEKLNICIELKSSRCLYFRFTKSESSRYSRRTDAGSVLVLASYIASF